MFRLTRFTILALTSLRHSRSGRTLTRLEYSPLIGQSRVFTVFWLANVKLHKSPTFEIRANIDSLALEIESLHHPLRDGGSGTQKTDATSALKCLRTETASIDTRSFTRKSTSVTFVILGQRQKIICKNTYWSILAGFSVPFAIINSREKDNCKDISRILTTVWSTWLRMLIVISLKIDILLRIAQRTFNYSLFSSFLTKYTQCILVSASLSMCLDLFFSGIYTFSVLKP